MSFWTMTGFFPRARARAWTAWAAAWLVWSPPGDLHQGHEVWRVPPVHAAEPGGILHPLGHVGDPQAGGVGGEQGLRGHPGGDRPEKGLLHRQVLGDVLHHEVRPVKGGVVGGVGHPPGDGSGVLGEKALGGQAV